MLKQWIELKSTPTNVTTTNNNYNNSSQTSNKVANICNINSRPPLTNEFFEELRANIDFINDVYTDEKDIIKYTLKHGINKYVAVVDRSRKILSFINDDGLAIRDQDGVKLAQKLFSELNKGIDNVIDRLNNLEDNPNEIYIPTTLDKRKKIAQYIKEKNENSIERMGKAYFNEYTKYDMIENKEQQIPQLKHETINPTLFSNFINIAKNLLYKYNFDPVRYGINQMGSFLNQFIDQFNLSVTNAELEIINDSGVRTRFNKDEFCELFLNILDIHDIEEILKILQKYPQDEVRRSISEIMHIFIFRQKPATEYQKTCLFNGFAGISDN